MFENKEFLWLLLIIPLAILFFIYCFKNKKSKIYKFVSMEMFEQISNININIYKIKYAVMVLCLFFIIIALARPQYGAKSTVVSKKAATIVIVMDVSKSMLAQDIKPNRLEFAKSALANLVVGFNGNKIGIIVFAGTAFWQCPITLDNMAANNFLSNISTSSVPLGGTKISKALDLALKGTSEIPEGAKAIILVTDGEDDDSGLHILIEKAKKYKTKIFTIGIGSKDGSKIVINNSYIKDENGNDVISKIDEETLQYIADETGGQYINLSESKDAIFKVLQIAKSLDKAKDDASKEIRREDQYHKFLFVALILFCIYLLLTPYRRNKI